MLRMEYLTSCKGGMQMPDHFQELCATPDHFCLLPSSTHLLYWVGVATWNYLRIVSTSLCPPYTRSIKATKEFTLFTVNTCECLANHNRSNTKAYYILSCVYCVHNSIQVFAINYSTCAILQLQYLCHVTFKIPVPYSQRRLDTTQGRCTVMWPYMHLAVVAGCFNASVYVLGAKLKLKRRRFTWN